jgi:hypothetical protein
VSVPLALEEIHIGTKYQDVRFDCEIIKLDATLERSAGEHADSAVWR